MSETELARILKEAANSGNPSAMKDACETAAMRLSRADQPRPAVPEDCVAFPKSRLRDIISVIGEHFPDCIDNDGQPYQSQHLADLLKAAQQPGGD